MEIQGVLLRPVNIAAIQKISGRTVDQDIKDKNEKGNKKEGKNKAAEDSGFV